MAMILDKRITDLALDVAAISSAGDGAAAWNAAPTSPTGAPLLRVPTTRFGTLEVEADLVITLPDGVIGFENCKRYIVVRHAENSAFRWLQSLDDPGVAFPIVEPGEFRPDYAPIIADSDARTLELSADTPTLVFAIVTVPPHNPRSMTANLLGPIVINGALRRGKQVIIQNEGFTTRHEIVEELMRAATIARTVASSVQAA